MGLVRTALIFGVGYALGRPEGQAKVVELAKRPEVAQARHRAATTVSRSLKRGRKQVAVGTDTADGSAVTTGRGGWRDRRLPSFPRRGTVPAATSAGTTPTGSASTQPEVPPVPSTQPLPSTRPTN